jgi:hypothetical protein
LIFGDVFGGERRAYTERKCGTDGHNRGQMLSRHFCHCQSLLRCVRVPNQDANKPPDRAVAALNTR